MKTLGAQIRELREGHDLSIRALAKKTDLSAPFLSDVELGRRHPSDKALRTIATCLGTTLEELKRHDARAPIQELRRMVASDPVMGFALRKMVDAGVTADELMEFLENRPRNKKT